MRIKWRGAFFDFIFDILSGGTCEVVSHYRTNLGFESWLVSKNAAALFANLKGTQKENPQNKMLRQSGKQKLFLHFKFNCLHLATFDGTDDLKANVQDAICDCHPKCVKLGQKGPSPAIYRLMVLLDGQEHIVRLLSSSKPGQITLNQRLKLTGKNLCF